MFREGLRPPNPHRDRDPLDFARTQDEMSLRALSRLGSVLALCAPAMGSHRCRVFLKWLAAHRDRIEGRRLRIVVVHTGTEEQARAETELYDLQYLARIADPERALYRRFGLGETKPGLLARAVGREPEPLPGVFMLRDGAVVKEWRASKPDEWPDFDAFL